MKKSIILILLFAAALSLLILSGCDGSPVIPNINSGMDNTNSEDVNDENNNDASGSEDSEDTTKPVITGSRDPLPNPSGWNNTDVTVIFTCEDVGEDASGIITNTVKGATVTTEGKDQSVTSTGECIDAAGNVADPVTVSGINIDKTPPVIVITLPGTGEYELNEIVTASWTATDNLSGVVSPSSGSINIDTSSAGTKTITLPAGTIYDKAGNLSFKVSKSYTIIDDNNDDDLIFTDKWDGLGMGIYYHNTGYIDMLLDNGFEYLRIDIPTYTNSTWLSQSKSAVQTAVTKGAKVIWGVSSNGTTITNSNWPNFRQAILDAAQWAQNNGVYEFQLGNEEEWHIDGTTMTANQIIQNLKSVATEVQKIFTNGKISYSCFPEFSQDWANAGKGDIDIIASNLYMGGNGNYSDYWKGLLDILINAFGVNNVYLTEFNVSWQSLTDYSTSEAEQAEAIFDMIEYIKNKGIKRAVYFCFRHDDYGVLKEDGTYRTLIWNEALLNSDTIRLAGINTRAETTSLY